MTKDACHVVYRVFARVTRSRNVFLCTHGCRDRSEGRVTEKRVNGRNDKRALKKGLMQCVCSGDGLI